MRGANMDVVELLEELEARLSEAARLPWPWQGRIVVEPEGFLRRLRQVREQLPEDLQKARRVLREGQRIHEEAASRATRVEGEAEARGRALVQAAQVEAARLLDEHELVARARQEAARLVGEAEAAARKLREEAEGEARRTRQELEAYLNRIMSGTEGELARVLELVRRGRENLLANAEAGGGRATEEGRPAAGAGPAPRLPAASRSFGSPGRSQASLEVRRPGGRGG